MKQQKSVKITEKEFIFLCETLYSLNKECVDSLAYFNNQNGEKIIGLIRSNEKIDRILDYSFVSIHDAPKHYHTFEYHIYRHLIDEETFKSFKGIEKFNL